MTDVQLVWIWGRRRDERGRLEKPGSRAREDTEDDVSLVGKAISMEEAFRQVKRYQSFKFKGRVVDGQVFKGWSEGDIDVLWVQYLADNPKLREQIDRKVRRDRRRARQGRRRG